MADYRKIASAICGMIREHGIPNRFAVSEIAQLCHAPLTHVGRILHADLKRIAAAVGDAMQQPVTLKREPNGDRVYISVAAAITPHRVVIDVPAERIADMMIGAIEGGSTYWCSRIDLVTPSRDALTERPWYADPALYKRDDFSIAVTADDEPKPYAITPASLMRGLQLMAARSSRHFADIINENGDATTADVFLQYVALGEVVYG